MPPRERDNDPRYEQRVPRVASSASVASLSDLADVSEGGNTKEYRVKRSKLIGMIDWAHVIGVHAPQLMILGILVMVGQLINQVAMGLAHQPDFWSMMNYETMKTIFSELSQLFLNLTEAISQSSRGFDLFSPAVKTTALLLLVGAYMMQRQNPVYLLSFATYKAPDSWKVSHEDICEIMRRQDCFTEKSIDFMRRILDRSGTGQATAWPPGIVQCLDGDGIKADASIEGSRKEAETIIFDIVDRALKSANLKPKDIDVLVINCSLFSPTPSLCAMVLSHFKMRPDTATYNLSGMGCAASLVSVDLAQKLLNSRSGSSKALVVSTEILTPNFYHGNDRGFLIQNTLFRCGGAAIVLSNSWLDGRRAWYKLLHCVRVQGTDQTSYDAVYETQCPVSGKRGVRLSKDIVKVAGKCMEKNFTTLGPSVLAFKEQAKVVLSIAARWLIKKLKLSFTPPKPYVPDFKSGIDHFCIHAGGRAVIDGIEKNLKLEPFHTEPSRMALLNYGNTSSSSIWYEMEYIQEYQKTNSLKKGDRIMQVAFGSGFKCTSGVWLKL